MLAADAAPEPEDLRRGGVRVDLDVVSRSGPQVARSTHQLVRLIAPIAVKAKRLERHGYDKQEKFLERATKGQAPPKDRR